MTMYILLLKQAREQSYNSANGIMTYACWNVGRRIVEQEQYGEKKARYGSYLIKNLSKGQSKKTYETYNIYIRIRMDSIVAFIFTSFYNRTKVWFKKQRWRRDRWTEKCLICVRL